MKWANDVGKIAPTDLLDAGLPQTFDSLKNAVSAKCNKMKCSEMRYICIGENLSSFVFGSDFSGTMPKALFHEKKKLKSWTSLKIKVSLRERHSTEWKDKPWTRRKYFQMMYLIMGLFPKYTKNS